MLLTRRNHSKDLKLAKKFTLVGTVEGEELAAPPGECGLPSSYVSHLLTLPPATPSFSTTPSIPSSPYPTQPVHPLAEESDQKDSESDVDLADLIKNNDLVSALVNDIANRQNVENATKNLSVNVIHPLREGKKLLVLDIDYSECVLV